MANSLVLRSCPRLARTLLAEAFEGMERASQLPEKHVADLLHKGNVQNNAHGANTSTLQRRPGARAARLSAVSSVAPSCSARAT